MNNNDLKKKNVAIRYKFKPLVIMYERLPLLLTVKYSYFRKTIACEAAKELGWLSISPDCSKSDISNSYLLFYVPSASRHYSAIKTCLKDISYYQREYPQESLCCYWHVRVEIGLRLIFFLLQNILKRKKTIERMSI